MDDDALLAAIAAGDDGALRTLFERHAPWLAGRLRRALPADSVEDVLQETFVAVWRGASTYRGDGAAGAWLWGIARRQAALWTRRHGRAGTDLVFDDQFGAATDDPAATASRRADLDRALATLGPDGSDGRDLARLVFVEDRPLVEVAHHFGVPEGTVKSRVFALRRRLRATLGDTP